MKKEIVKKLIDTCYETGLKEFESKVCKKQDAGYEKIKLAADAGLLEAQLEMGYLFEMGKGWGTWDDAIKYFEMASKQGSSEADFNLGIIYYRTRWTEEVYSNTDENGKVTVKWKYCTKKDVETYLRKSAEANYSQAQFILGKEFLFGNDIMKADKKEAKKWLELAAGNGVEEATELLKEKF